MDCVASPGVGGWAGLTNAPHNDPLKMGESERKAKIAPSFGVAPTRSIVLGGGGLQYLFTFPHFKLGRPPLLSAPDRPRLIESTGRAASHMDGPMCQIIVWMSCVIKGGSAGWAAQAQAFHERLFRAAVGVYPLLQVFAARRVV